MRKCLLIILRNNLVINKIINSDKYECQRDCRRDLSINERERWFDLSIEENADEAYGL